MMLPMIDVASLPSLDSVTSMFGSLLPGGQAESSTDEILLLMVFLYDLMHPGGGNN